MSYVLPVFIDHLNPQLWNVSFLRAGIYLISHGIPSTQHTLKKSFLNNKGPASDCM